MGGATIHYGKGWTEAVASMSKGEQRKQSK